MNNRKNILVADDIESIRFAIKDYLESSYNVYVADSGIQAMEILKNNSIDFIISDIRMPEMGGLELIQHVKKNYPDIQFALMTAYNVNDYIEYARKENIWNIIPKSSSLDLSFIKTMIEKNLTGDIFGVEKYIPDLKKERISYEDLISSGYKMSKNILYILSASDPRICNSACDAIGNLMVQAGCPSIIRQVLDELVSNAIGHSMEKIKEKKVPVEISFGKINNKYIIGILDHNGLLDREEILYRIERHIKLDKNGLPVGISDSHGRGLFISRENLDHLIFNIEKNKKTEVIGFISEDISSKNKSLAVYQIESAAAGKN